MNTFLFKDQFSMIFVALMLGQIVSIDNRKGINIDPPKNVFEVLPPKPIVVAPLLVKNHRQKIKVANYNTATPPGWGYNNPPQNLPFLGASGPNIPRSLNTISNNAFHYPLPKVTGEVFKASNQLYLNDSEKDLQKDIVRSVKAKMFSTSAHKMHDLKRALISLEDNIQELHSKALNVNNRINEKLIAVEKLRDDSFRK